MRALSIRQPWAGLVAAGAKPVENRGTRTSYRGPLAIHASAGWSEAGSHDRRVRAALGRRPLHRDYGDDQLGAVIAVAQLVDCHHAAALDDTGSTCCSPWGDRAHESPRRGRVRAHHLVLTDVVLVDPAIRLPGALGLWRLPEPVAEQLTNLVLEPR